MDALWDASQVATLEARRAEGWSASMIAAVLGVSRSAVCGKMRRLRMKAPPKSPSMVARHASPHISPGMPIGERRPIPPTPIHLGDGIAPAPGCVPLARRSGVANAILHRRHIECAWPIGAVEADTFHFCCAAVRKIGEPYCEEHFQRAKP
jgi:hypothetical protein